MVIYAPRRNNTALWVLLGVLGVFALGVVGCVALVGAGLEEAAENFDGAMEEAAAEQQAEAVEEFREVDLAECVTDRFGTPSGRGTLTNGSSKMSNYWIEVNFYRTEGEVLFASGFTVVNNVPAGGTAEWEVTTFETGVDFPWRCQVVKVDRTSAVG